jgi:hypothetical protein
MLVVGLAPFTGAGRYPEARPNKSTGEAVAGKIARTVTVPPAGWSFDIDVAPDKVKGPTNAGDAGHDHRGLCVGVRMMVAV